MYRALRTVNWSILAPVLAFFIYGGWAAFVNSEYGTTVWLKAGLGQGCYALFSTWIVTLVTQKTFTRVGADWRGFVLGFVAGFAIMVAIPLFIHNVLGTPDILEAIAPGLVWGSFYVMFVLRVTYKQQLAELNPQV